MPRPPRPLVRRRPSTDGPALLQQWRSAALHPRLRSRSLNVRAFFTALACAAALTACAPPALSDEPARLMPAPRVDARQTGSQTAVLAGGCFWGLEGVFEHVRGVERVRSGYAGGDARRASYDQVTSG